MIKKWMVTIPKLTGSEKRRVYLYLPDSVRFHPNKRFPVLYMFDGHNVFFDSDATYGKSWGMKKYMDRTKTQMIIVAVECNHSPDHGRLKEYSPFDFTEDSIGTIKGKGKLTMDWFVSYLKPFIDKHYPTIPDREHTFISGSSMGGLMSIYALLHYNKYFSRAAALSPSLWISPEASAKMIQSANVLPNTVLYTDYGEIELDNHLDNRSAFGSMMTLLMEKGILLNARIVPGGEHTEASWEKQIPIFMKTLLY